MANGTQFSKAMISGAIPLAPRLSIKYRSPLRYPGGKQKAIEQISRMFPSNAREYREPMVGGGSVFFHARNRDFARKYWINDLFTELVSFWRTGKDLELCNSLVNELKEFRSAHVSAEELKDYFLKAREEETEDPYRQAFLFFFFNRVTFSGTTRAGGFSASASQSRFTQSSIERLCLLPEALENTKITEMDFEEVIRTPGTDVFLFIDPPYYTASKLYGRNGGLHSFDHIRLASVLKKTNHKFLITYDDCEEIRNLYGWANLKEWRLQYGMNNCNTSNTSKIGSELFISNY